MESENAAYGVTERGSVYVRERERNRGYDGQRECLCEGEMGGMMDRGSEGYNGD